MRIANYIAGGGVVLTGYGFTTVSGGVAFDGLAHMTGLPAFGVVGPLTALGAASLGIAVETRIKERQWVQAVICGGLCLAFAATDAYFGERSLERRNAESAQVLATKQAAFDEAAKAVSDARTTIADIKAEKAVLNGPDVKAAQKLLGVLPDGDWGPITSGKRDLKNAKMDADMAKAEAIIEAKSAVIAKGAPVPEAGITLPAWMALVITAGAVICSFLGSVIAFGLKPEKTKTEMERAAEAAKAEAVTLVRDALQERTGMLRDVAAAIRKAA